MATVVASGLKRLVPTSCRQAVFFSAFAVRRTYEASAWFVLSTVDFGRCETAEVKASRMRSGSWSEMRASLEFSRRLRFFLLCYINETQPGSPLLLVFLSVLRPGVARTGRRGGSGDGPAAPHLGLRAADGPRLRPPRRQPSPAGSYIPVQQCATCLHSGGVPL